MMMVVVVMVVVMVVFVEAVVWGGVVVQLFKNVAGSNVELNFAVIIIIIVWLHVIYNSNIIIELTFSEISSSI